MRSPFRHKARAIAPAAVTGAGGASAREVNVR